MRTALAAWLCIAFALSGCAGSPQDGGTGDGTGTDAPQAPMNRTLPAETHFAFGQSAGCAGDAHSLDPRVPLNCASFQGGPDATGIDGHWLALDETYAGLTLTTTMAVPGGANADSDCVFLAADAVTETGNGNNGSAACTGTVPPGTAWLFLYPWGTPASGMTADFTA